MKYDLTEAQLERLAILSEECGEVVQIIGKIIRHGYQSCNPFDEDKTTNRTLLEKELGDLQFAIQLMKDGDDIEGKLISKYKTEKRKKISRYLHHNRI